MRSNWSDQITDFNANISTYITSGVYVTEANGVLDVTADVVAVDRDATLAGDYTFTGNVNLSSSASFREIYSLNPKNI